MQNYDTNIIYVDGVPKHYGKDAQALMTLAKALYAHKDSEVIVSCPEFPEHSGRAAWMRFDRQSGTWVEANR